MQHLQMPTDRASSRLGAIAEQVLDTYDESAAADVFEDRRLPNSAIVVDITDDLIEILLPDYPSRRPRRSGSLTFHISNLIDDLHRRLAQQIAHALRHGSQDVGKIVASDAIDSLAEQKAIEFLSKLPRIRKLLIQDIQAAYDGDPAATSRDEIISCYPGLQAVAVYRLAHELYQLQIPLVPRMMTECVHSRTGIDIHPGATIGPGFFIDHGTGVVIGQTTHIAANVKLYQGVTLGALNFSVDERGDLIRGQKRHPTLQKGVVVYANATILGGETVVGENSVVGAGVTLSRSLEPNTIVTIEKPTLRFRVVA